MTTTFMYLHIVSALIFAFASAESLSEKCKNTIDNVNLGQLCLIQNEIESMQIALERIQIKLDKISEKCKST